MKKILASTKVYVEQSRIYGAGKGVFANISIKKGELIERCPTIELTEDETAHLDGSILVTYLIYFGDKALIMLGFGSIYNHAYSPNAKLVIREDGRMVDFVALQDIQASEEITFNYKHENWADETKLWFES